MMADVRFPIVFCEDLPPDVVLIVSQRAPVPGTYSRPAREVLKSGKVRLETDNAESET